LADATPHQLFVDPGIAPLVSHLGIAPAFRLWLVARDLDTAGAGIVSKRSLRAALPSYGIDISREYFNRLIAAGYETFWNTSELTGYNPKTHIRLCGYRRLWRKLTHRLPADIARDIRPQHRVLVSVAGSAADFNAQLYAAWIDTRNRKGSITMSRELLCRIWNTTTMTLLSWETAAGVSVIENRAQYAGSNPHVPPAHAYAYPRKDGTVGAAWQMPNTYTNSQTFRHHPHTGQKRKAQKARARVLESIESASICEAGQATGRLYFTGKTPLEASKTVRRHLRKHGDVERHHFVRLGEMVRRRGVVVIHECYDAHTDLLHTERDDRYTQHDDVFAEIARTAQMVGATGVGIRWKSENKTIYTNAYYTHTPTRPPAANHVTRLVQMVRPLSTAASRQVKAHRLRRKLTQQTQAKRGRRISLKEIGELGALLLGGDLLTVQQRLDLAHGVNRNLSGTGGLSE
jgi:hypothetical protein